VISDVDDLVTIVVDCSFILRCQISMVNRTSLCCAVRSLW